MIPATQTHPASVINSSQSSAADDTLIASIRDYWDSHIHDLAIASHPVGTKEFFRELDAYRAEKLIYLPGVIDFASCRGLQLLEVGCGLGLDLARFAQYGASVTGIDLAPNSILLARRHFELNQLQGTFLVMNGEAMQFPANRFDVVYAHGVLQYTACAERMIEEIRRVLKPGGRAILMVYNRYSWLNALSRCFMTRLEHQDAPVLRTYSKAQFREMLSAFTRTNIIPERFPVQTRIHPGIRGAVYNAAFVRAFNELPKALTRPLGWHLIAKAVK